MYESFSFQTYHSVVTYANLKGKGQWSRSQYTVVYNSVTNNLNNSHDNLDLV